MGFPNILINVTLLGPTVTNCLLLNFVLQVNLTSAPMISFIFQSQLVYNAMTYHVVDPADQMKGFLSIALLLWDMELKVPLNCVGVRWGYDT